MGLLEFHKVKGLMEEDERMEEVIRRAAARGARTCTRSRQTIDDAARFAIERWEDAVIRKKHIADWEAWAYRIGTNAARKLGQVQADTGSSTAESALGQAAARPAQGHEDAAETRSMRVTAKRILRAHLTRNQNLLRGRQLEVVLKLAQPNMSLHRAAKEIGMARPNLRRAFRSALRRLKQRSR